MRVYKVMGYGPNTCSTITHEWLVNMEVLFMDNTDLFIINKFMMSRLDILEEIKSALTVLSE